MASPGNRKFGKELNLVRRPTTHHEDGQHIEYDVPRGLDRKAPKSGLASSDLTANLSGLVLGCIEAYVSRL